MFTNPFTRLHGKSSIDPYFFFAKSLLMVLKCHWLIIIFQTKKPKKSKGEHEINSSESSSSEDEHIKVVPAVEVGFIFIISVINGFPFHCMSFFLHVSKLTS